MPSENELKAQTAAPVRMSQKEFITKLREKMPDLSNFNDVQLWNAVIKRRPDLVDKVDNPMAGDAAAARAQGKAQLASQSLVDPEYWHTHPNTAGFTRGVLNSLPAAGGIAGGVLSTPESFGTATLPGTALGAGAGRGLRDLAAHYLGLEKPSSPWEKAKNIGVETAIAAATPGVTEAALHPVDTAKMAVGDYARLTPKNLRPWVTPQILEDFANSVNKQPYRTPVVSNFAHDVADTTRTVEGQVMPDNFRFDPRGSYFEGEFTDPGESLVPTRPQTTQTAGASSQFGRRLLTSGAHLLPSQTKKDMADTVLPELPFRKEN